MRGHRVRAPLRSSPNNVSSAQPRLCGDPERAKNLRRRQRSRSRNSEPRRAGHRRGDQCHPVGPATAGLRAQSPRRGPTVVTAVFSHAQSSTKPGRPRRPSREQQARTWRDLRPPHRVPGNRRCPPEHRAQISLHDRDRNRTPKTAQHTTAQAVSSLRSIRRSPQSARSPSVIASVASFHAGSMLATRR